MGIQASTIGASGSGNLKASSSSGKSVFGQKHRNSTRLPRSRVGILAFEVSSAMTKCVQLWYSLSEAEIRRLTAEVIKSEGVLNLVSSDEKVLLDLAAMEKLHELTAIAFAVARLGKRCSEPSLTGFEHIYSDILRHVIDAAELGYTKKEMDAKVKKMEKYVASTSSLYQELELLAEMELALRRLHEDKDPAHKESIDTLQQKTAWQRREVNYLKEVSLWSQTHDKAVGYLARSVCTMYGRIIQIFGFPAAEGCAQILSLPNDEDAGAEGEDRSASLSRIRSASSSDDLLKVRETDEDSSKLEKLDKVAFSEPDAGAPSPREADVSASCEARSSSAGTTRSRPHRSNDAHLGSAAANGSLDDSDAVTDRSTKPNARVDGSIAGNLPNADASLKANPESSGSIRSPSSDTFMASFCFSPGRQSQHRRSTSGASHRSRSAETAEDDGAFRDPPQLRNRPNLEGVSRKGANRGRNRQLFDPKCKLQDAPPSTLGGSALALHYANAVIIAEKMARYPHLITQDARDDLYQMLPKSVRMRLRGKLRSLMRGCSNSLECECALVGEWREALEKALAWLAPMAHNMIRWQSEHNFEQQQQIVSRPNVLLLQTLYFADREKAEAAITELLVGLNCLWRYERDFKANLYMEYAASNKDFDEYSSWDNFLL